MVEDNKTYPKALINSYVKMIRTGKRTTDAIKPQALRELVEAALENE